ncbi:transposase [Clostridiaceae bacterium 35-E11]
MIDRSRFREKVILIADRGYENYNIFAHAEEKNWKYLIRGKDITSNGVVSGLGITEEGTFDKNISLTLTRSQTKAKKSKEYKFMPTCQGFDYIPIGSAKEYTLHFRVVRFPIADDSYETIIINLRKEEFSAEDIKKIYHLRWGIETSLRELKYAVGLINFHAKKVEYIKQEIFARLTMYNYCEAIITQILIKQTQKEKVYQVNFTLAIFICREYLNNKRSLKPPDIVLLIQRNILPIRPGRHDPRKVSTQKPVSFLYRVA